jgi:ABC-type transport system involved in Fe-S cluster assembly fused permease/ATPase subunit
MAKYERASVKTYSSLAMLNMGQAAIFTAGAGHLHDHVGHRCAAGRNSVGHFVMINALMIQLAQPLNFMGMLYREIKQAVVDIEHDVLDPAPECRGHRPAEARPLACR